MSPAAELAVKLILDDLTDRVGLSNAWEEIDEDIRDEITNTWAALIDTAIRFDLERQLKKLSRD